VCLPLRSSVVIAGAGARALRLPLLALLSLPHLQLDRAHALCSEPVAVVNLEQELVLFIFIPLTSQNNTEIGLNFFFTPKNVNHTVALSEVFFVR
jgi:hypothetical protein